MYKADRRLFLDESKTIAVEESDPRARYLLVGEGGEIPIDEARKYGLVEDKPKHAEAAEPPATEPPAPETDEPASKMREPAENKMRARDEDK